MSDKSQIKLKAVEDAPEFIQAGNLLTEKKAGYFHVEKREFADWIVAEGYAEEVGDEPTASEAEAETTKTKQLAKTKQPAKAKPVKTAATPATDVPPTDSTEDKTKEGEAEQ